MFLFFSFLGDKLWLRPEPGQACLGLSKVALASEISKPKLDKARPEPWLWGQAGAGNALLSRP